MLRLYRYLSFSAKIQLTESQIRLKGLLDHLNSKLVVKDERGWKFFSKPKIKRLRGIYIYGGVGQGKTMMMDLFYEQVAVPKHRIHFHEFMVNIQRKIHSHKETRSTDSSIDDICKDLVKKFKLLCLDEFHVTHISDAMILKQLFTKLFEYGLVLVCTSNRSPDELYMNGLNRDRFLPFIPLLYENCEVYNLDSNEDFRQTASTTGMNHEHVFFMDKDLAFLLNHYKSLNPGAKIKENEILQITPLRSIKVPYSTDSTAFFNFTDICGSKGEEQDKKKIALGTDAYLTIAQKFHTIYVNQIPPFNANVQLDGQLRSFMLFIDILYERLVLLRNVVLSTISTSTNSSLQSSSIYRNIKLLLSTSVPILKIFGLYGIVRIANAFQMNLEWHKTKLPNKITPEEFINMGKEFEITEKDMNQLYDALLGPEEEYLTGVRVEEIMDNHKNLLLGRAPKYSGLYKFDIKDDTVAENEFACSRTLSRLFHMSSNDYLSKCQK